MECRSCGVPFPLLLAVCALVCLASCSGDDTLLLVEVRTDYEQVTEFDAIEVQAADQVVRHEVQALSDYAAGVRVAELTGLRAGPTLVAVRLLLGDDTIQEESMSVDVTDHTALSFEILRDCSGGSCADGGVDDDASADADAGADGGVDGDVGVDARTCDTATLMVQNDTVIFDSSCNVANHNGASTFLNLGLDNAHGLFRFDLTGEMRSALLDGSVSNARLVLIRTTDCDGSPCPADAGSIGVRPMRSDWDEGATTASYAGADWCRRTAGMTGLQWSSPGASAAGVDVGDDAGSTTFGMDEPQITIDLDPGAFGEWADGSTGTPRLSLRTAASAMFVAAAREGGEDGAARLELDICR